MIQSTIETLIEPAINDLGYVLWGCEYLPQGKYSLLRIYIDSDNGITLEDCEAVSRQVSALLDVEDPIQGNYNLEVSSPGVPRPLFYSWQFQQYIGQTVNLKLWQPVGGKRKISGNIISADDTNLVLNIENETQTLPFSNIHKAYLTV